MRCNLARCSRHATVARTAVSGLVFNIAAVLFKKELN